MDLRYEEDIARNRTRKEEKLRKRVKAINDRVAAKGDQLCVGGAYVRLSSVARFGKTEAKDTRIVARLTSEHTSEDGGHRHNSFKLQTAVVPKKTADAVAEPDFQTVAWFLIGEDSVHLAASADDSGLEEMTLIDIDNQEQLLPIAEALIERIDRKFVSD